MYILEKLRGTKNYKHFFFTPRALNVISLPLVLEVIMIVCTKEVTFFLLLLLLLSSAVQTNIYEN